LKRFLRRVQNVFGLRIKKIRSNNGKEFKNAQMEDFLDEGGTFYLVMTQTQGHTKSSTNISS
jgi:hypothetical protein